MFSLSGDPILSTYHSSKHCKHKKIRILYCHHCWWKQFTTLNTTISNNNYIGEHCSCKSRYDEEIVYICENEREIFYPCSYCNLFNDGVHTYHSQCVDDTVFEFTPFSGELMKGENSPAPCDFTTGPLHFSCILIGFDRVHSVSSRMRSVHCVN